MDCSEKASLNLGSPALGWNQAPKDEELLRLGSCSPVKRCNRVICRIEYLEQCQEPCSAQHIFCVRGEVCKLDVTPGLPNRRIGSDKTSHAPAIDLSDTSKVKNDSERPVHKLFYYGPKTC